jgi:hypothetical protein
MTVDALALIGLTALAHAFGLAIAVALHRKLADAQK